MKHARHSAAFTSARCHDEEANLLAINLMHDIVTGAKTVEEARAYYGKEFLDYRRSKPTPYMEKLRFATCDESTGDPDQAILTEDDLLKAKAQGKQGK
ncbi:hypothetical protein H0A65_01425 [Alcaligenaceae bacterium]|nr:hypothetical protein [Alcaligenaceae bacterium]